MRLFKFFLCLLELSSNIKLVIFIFFVSSFGVANLSCMLMMHFLYLVRRRRNVPLDKEFITINFDRKGERKILVLALLIDVNSFLF
ncbi:hypothetical protein VIGAN_05211000 [Vigna angularis var. angularis]|uniref:Uncharacterized protein n=1 Tax=Vigna angularis var. angularis TaxID=157739 RepID=A0A0S3S6X9_PHAAN|nr:hypothetical protein VIGAN_05211000 [Vigna angularis var. angularis]